MQLCHIQSGDKLISLLEVFLRLAASTHNHINTDKSIRHHFLNLFHLRCEKSGIITTTHQFQHLIATGLQRNMKMRHKTTRTGYELNNFVCQQIWLNGRYTITFDSFNLIQCFYMIKKGFSCCLTEISDIDTCQYNFFSAFGSSLPGLFHHRSDCSVTATPTGKRNRTIRTKIITAVLHFQEKAGTVSTGTRG